LKAHDIQNHDINEAAYNDIIIKKNEGSPNGNLGYLNYCRQQKRNMNDLYYVDLSIRIVVK
jgi:hypothetical protein